MKPCNAGEQWARVEKIRVIIEETVILHGAFQADVVLAFLEIICAQVSCQDDVDKVNTALRLMYLAHKNGAVGA